MWLKTSCRYCGNARRINADQPTERPCPVCCPAGCEGCGGRHNDFIDHWPTPEEADALAEAKRQADINFTRGDRGATNTGRVRVRGGNGAVASVWRDAPQSYTAFIQAPNPAAASGWMTIKGWWGVPELAQRPSTRTNIRAPAEQVHYVPEDIHVIRQQRVRHHWREPEHIHHGAPPVQAIELEAAQVHVARPEQAAIHHHEPKRGFWATVLLGPGKHGTPATAREEPRGALRTVEPSPAALARQEAPLALPAPSQLPAAASRQLAYKPETQLPVPAPRKRGLFSRR